MKGGRDEEKITSPLFPRLHVNDTEKGGPRAPPRNKMALYEQFSIPSQRISSGSASTLPLPPNNASTLVPSVSSSQGGGHERTVFSSFYIPPALTDSAKKNHSCSSSGVDLNTTMADLEQKSMNNADYRTSNATEHLLSTAECSSLQPHDFSKSTNSCGKKLGDEDDFRVPTFVYSGSALSSSKDQHSIDKGRFNPFIPSHTGRSTVTPGNSLLKTAVATCNSSMQLQNARDKHLKRTNTTDLRLRQQVRNQSEDNSIESATSKDCTEKLVPHPSTREKIAETLKHTNASPNQNHQRSPMGDFERVCGTNAWLHQGYRAGLQPENTARINDFSAEPMGCVEKGNVSKARSESCSRASLYGHRSLNEAENGSEYRVEKAHGSLQVGDLDRDDDVSETSMVDSISVLDISPDDVVGVIGQKHFWKARRAIVNQQRLFAVQVFELHRLIKVQKLIAGSPCLLHEDNPYLSEPMLKVSPAKKLPIECVLKSPPQIVKRKDDSQKPNQSTECAAENVVGKPPLPSLSHGVNNGHVGQHLSYGTCSGNPSPAPVATDNKVGPWCFHPPPGNQWLVPVMSPSEGLVYKPYTGSFPPTAGFMAPIYGGCGPMSLPPVAGGFLNPAYGVPASHPQGMGVGAPPVAHSYFPPYGMPVMNPVLSASAVEQVSPLAGSQPHGHTEQLSTGEVNYNMHSRSSCNMATQKNEAISHYAWKFQKSKDSEIQGSTASSPCERVQGAGAGQVSEGRDALPLFPMAPAGQCSDQPSQTQNSDQQTRVIKVVPHNPRSATESAARIFQSIQEERQQYD